MDIGVGYPARVAEYEPWRDEIHADPLYRSMISDVKVTGIGVKEFNQKGKTNDRKTPLR